jgi:hypothetical protein
MKKLTSAYNHHPPAMVEAVLLEELQRQMSP